MAPLLPLGFIMAYQVDAAYGTLTHRMRGAATPPAATAGAVSAERSQTLLLCTF